MTKDQAIAFLSEAGHAADVHEVNETFARISFKSRGTFVKLFTDSDDPDFLHLVCSFDLKDIVLDELAVARILATVQDDIKVVKLSADLEKKYVAASAEEFIPAETYDFEPIFWRTVDLVVRAAAKANYEIHRLASTDAAAERFTEEIESTLHLDGKTPSNSLQVLRVYRYEGTYAFDDPRMDLMREPFVMGMPGIIEHQLGGPVRSFTAVFSAAPFPGHTSVLKRIRSENDGNWYRLDGSELEGWLCPALLKYFNAAPDSLYVQLKDAVALEDATLKDEKSVTEGGDRGSPGASTKDAAGSPSSVEAIREDHH